jgi:hypothetical protein
MDRRYLGGPLVTAASVLLPIAVHGETGGREPAGAPAAESAARGGRWQRKYARAGELSACTYARNISGNILCIGDYKIVIDGTC